MGSRTLASISGRTAHYSTGDSSETVNPSISQRPRKRIKKLKDDPPPAKTESVYSDDPVPASSGVFSPNIPVFSLEKSFPSILSTANLMRAIKGPHYILIHQSLGLVFLSCLRTIVGSMSDLPHGVPLNPRYEVAQYAVMYAGSLLEKELDRQKPVQNPEAATRPQHSAIMILVDTILETLRTFLKVVGQLFADNKPLPVPPCHFGDKSGAENTATGGKVSPGQGKRSVGKEDESLMNVVKDVIKREEEPAQYDTADPSCETPDVKRKSRSGLLIYRVVRRRARFKGSLAAHFAASSLTLIDLAPVSGASKEPSIPISKESWTARVKERPADIQVCAYLPRRSAIYYLADPYNPEHVEMPFPTEETCSIRLDHKGDIKAASLNALVRILTTIESVKNQEFIPTFFVCFRFFTTPRLFLQALINRFNERPPNSYNPLQLEVWIRSRVNDHIRIAKAILLWLELYWKSDVDNEVLPELQDFVIYHLVFAIPPGLGDAVLEALDLVDGDSPFCRRSRKAHDLDFVYKHGGKTEIPPNNFTIKINPDHLTGKQILSFDSPSGREEFARQLTIWISEKFRQVDPEDAIKYWHLKEQKSSRATSMEVGHILRAIIEFERALCSWVTFSILDEISRTNRRIFIEFWLDVSANVNLSSKQQFRVLERFFDGHDNYASYREVLSSVEPTVPMLAPLIRDVVSVLNVVAASIEAGDKSTDRMINFRSYSVVLKTVRAMESCLIPYELTNSDEFRVWLEPILQRFPSPAEAELHNNFYVQSKQVEAKDGALNHIHDPWNYIVRGELADKYTLHELPPVPSLPRPRKKNRLAALFRKV
ncbi:hypothetical protein C0993_003679 [Termitomyces sp. T159_Od127]|nr:hypothetical protein C0993_003679 [Termitomyces sp. T159_Od127]